MAPTSCAARLRSQGRVTRQAGRNRRRQYGLRQWYDARDDSPKNRKAVPVSYAQTFPGGWSLTMERLDRFAVLRLVRGDERYELITDDMTALELPGMGYRPAVTQSEGGDPWVLWKPADQSPLYVWLCPHNATMWTDDVRIDGGMS